MQRGQNRKVGGKNQTANEILKNYFINVEKGKTTAI